VPVKVKNMQLNQKVALKVTEIKIKSRSYIYDMLDNKH
jgi:hypothetical protein